MEFDKGKAYPTEERDRLYVFSENYRLDIFDHGKPSCFMCKADSVVRESQFKEGEPGYLLRDAKCTSCMRKWHEVYAIAGCRLSG